MGAGREVEAKRWLRCLILQAAGSTTVWLVWQISFVSTAGKYLWFVPSPWTCLWFLIFQASQMLYLIGKLFVTTFQEKEAVSVLDLIFGVWKMTCIIVFGTSVEPEATRHLPAKISTRRYQVVFVCLCSISGFLLLVALVSTQLMPPNVLDIEVHGAALGLVSTQLTPPNVLDIGVRGAALGLAYACLHLFQKKEVLAFPHSAKLRLQFEDWKLSSAGDQCEADHGGGTCRCWVHHLCREEVCSS